MIARHSCTVRAAASRASARTDRLTRPPLTTIASISSAVAAINARSALSRTRASPSRICAAG